MSRKRSQKKGPAGAPTWMVTYSDLVTLLLTFFVLLLSMANMDKQKLEDATGSLRHAFGTWGVTDAGSKNQINKPTIVEFAPISDDMVSRLYFRVQTEMRRLHLEKDIELVKDRGAIILRIKGTVLFDSGKSRLKEEAKPALTKAAKMIENLPLNLRIEGHADNKKGAKTGGHPNWRLSMDRAVSVLEFFAINNLIELNKMSTVGYGDQRPLVPNTSPENRSKNRRVELVLESIGSNREELPYLLDMDSQFPF